jgi:hypothetical protein
MFEYMDRLCFLLEHITELDHDERQELSVLLTLAKTDNILLLERKDLHVVIN